MLKNPKHIITFIALVILAFSFPIQSSAHSCCEQRLSGELAPDNTVILSNQRDARFSRDFSVLLKHLRLEWVVLDSLALPDSVKDKNLILLGRLDAAYTGEIMREIMTVEEIETFRATADAPVVIEKDSPWMKGRSIYICTGADLLLTRDAAEEAVRAILASSPPASDWIQTTYDAELDADLRDYVESLQFDWEDDELPLQDLTMDVRARPAGIITSQQAAEDVERLFYLFSHGYAGYAFFNQQGEFEQAKTRILHELPAQVMWTGDAFAGLLQEHLEFIIDCHLKVGDHKFAGHSDFWYDSQLEFTPGTDGYQFESDSITHTAISINNADPASYLYPSLNQGGEPVYRLGVLSKEQPPALRLVAANEEGEHRFDVKMQRSEFKYYADDVFRADVVGGIPVMRIRGFGDSHPDELSEFVETGSELRGEPVVIVDIRGNGGGNEHWPISWIQGLTGRRAETIFAFSELESKTSMVGRANTFNYYYEVFDVTSYSDEVAQFAGVTEAFENGTRQPHWTGPIYPRMPLIANDTTVILVTNGLVASAGEGMVLRISQAENVVVVGENTMGCLTFGNTSAHLLPHSRLMVWMPINFGLFLDQEFREELGLAPDLWVPASEAVNYAVAAVRSGTITTRQPLPGTTLQQAFVPEDPWARVRQEKIILLAFVALCAVASSVWAYFMRGKARIVAGIGVVWLSMGGVWIYMGKPVGFGFLLGGVVCLVWGGINLWRAKRDPVESPA